MTEQIYEAVKPHPAVSEDQRHHRGIHLFKRAYRGASFEAFWLQFGNFDPFCKAKAKSIFK